MRLWWTPELRAVIIVAACIGFVALISETVRRIIGFVFIVTMCSLLLWYLVILFAKRLAR